MTSLLSNVGGPPVSFAECNTCGTFILQIIMLLFWGYYILSIQAAIYNHSKRVSLLPTIMLAISLLSEGFCLYVYCKHIWIQPVASLEMNGITSPCKCLCHAWILMLSRLLVLSILTALLAGTLKVSLEWILSHKTRWLMPSATDNINCLSMNRQDCNPTRNTMHLATEDEKKKGWFLFFVLWNTIMLNCLS